MVHVATIKDIKYLRGKPIAILYYREYDTTIKAITKSFVREYNNLIKFFGLQPKAKIHIHFVYTRKEMDKHWGAKSPRWLCGTVSSASTNVVYIFSPLVFEKLTTHKKKTIIPTIIHEVAHVFVSEINKITFAWLNEGVCQFVEGQGEYINIMKKENWQWFREKRILTDTKVPWIEIAKHEGYKTSLSLVNFIIKHYGKDALIKLLKIKRGGKKQDIEKRIFTILRDNVDQFLDKVERSLRLI